MPTSEIDILKQLTLLGLGLIKINDVSANFNNPRPSLILNNYQDLQGLSFLAEAKVLTSVIYITLCCTF